MNHRLSLIAGGLACTLALAGCGSDGSSNTADEGSSSPASPTTSEAPSGGPSGGPSGAPSEASSDSGTTGAPSLPAEVTGESQEAAKAFVGYWIAALNFATDTGRTERLKSLASADCDNCAAFAQQLDQIYAAGGHVEGEGWTLSSAVPEADRPKDQPAFQLDLQIAPQKVFQKKGAKPQSYPGGKQPARMVLVRQGDRWLVDDLDI